MHKDSLIDRIIQVLMKKPMSKAELMQEFKIPLSTLNRSLAKIEKKENLPIKEQCINGVYYISIDVIKTLNNEYYMNIYLSPSNIVVAGRIFTTLDESLNDKGAYGSHYKYIKTIKIYL